MKDRDGHPVAGVTVTFSVEAGSGTISGEAVQTGSDGMARLASWRLGPLPGENRLRARSGNLSPVTFTATARLLLPTTTVNGSVILPTGSQLTVSTLRVESAVTDVPVGSGGTFTAVAQPGKTQFAAVHTPGGAPILMAWLDDSHHTFTVHTTAEVMAFLDLRAYLHPESGRRIIRDYLASQADLSQLEAAITAAIRVDPANLTLATKAVLDARRSLAQRLVSGSVVAGPARGTIIDPLNTSFSGIHLDQTGLNSFTLTNNWRRRAAAFVDRVSYKPAGGGASLPSPLPGQKINLAGVSATTTIIGTFLDIAAGKYAWVPVVSEPIPAPLFPVDALSTRYRVLVVGPGKPTGVILSAVQQAALDDASRKTLLLDIVLPIWDLLVTGAGNWELLGETGIEKLVHDFFDANPAPTEIKEAIEEGHWEEAVAGAEKLLFETERGQEFLFEHLFEPYGNVLGASSVSMAKRFKEWQKALFVVEAIATTIAIEQVYEAVTDANQADTWDVTATGAHVSLTPPNSRINQLDIQVFDAKVLEATGGGPAPEFLYRWSTSGGLGEICADQAIPSCGTVIETPVDKATYAPDPAKEGTGQVKVEVFIRERDAKIAIAETTTQITTVATKVSIDPAAPTVPAGGSTTLAVRLDTPPQNLGVLSYQWSAVGTYGSFVPAFLNGLESDKSSIPYKAKSGVAGSEPVSVTVYSLKDGSKRLVGRATTTVKVDDKQLVVQGRYFSESHSLPNNRICSGAYLAFPLVEGARWYDLHAYNFNDTLFWGTEINQPIFLVSYPSWGTCDVKGLISGVNGNEFVFMLTGGSGPVSVFKGLGPTDARFAGIKIEVTVHFDF